MSRYCIVGSHTLNGVPAKVASYLGQLQPADVLLRAPRVGDPGRFERITAMLCSVLDIPVSWRMPETGGRSATFFRDIEMVGEADCVLAFFDGSAMWGGTEHVVEKAIDRQVPVYSYGIEQEYVGAHRWLAMRLIGSHGIYPEWDAFTC